SESQDEWSGASEVTKWLDELDDSPPDLEAMCDSDASPPPCVSEPVTRATRAAFGPSNASTASESSATSAGKPFYRLYNLEANGVDITHYCDPLPQSAQDIAARICKRGLPLPPGYAEEFAQNREIHSLALI